MNFRKVVSVIGLCTITAYTIFSLIIVIEVVQDRLLQNRKCLKNPSDNFETNSQNEMFIPRSMYMPQRDEIACFVMSAAENSFARSAIRRTWGKSLKPIFIMNLTDKHERLENEAVLFDDMIIFNGSISTDNKHLFAMKYFGEYFENSKYFLYVHDDVFINTKNLFKFLNDEIPSDVVVGNFAGISHQSKITNWISNVFNFPFESYLNHLDLSTYIVPGSMIKEMFNKLQKISTTKSNRCTLDLLLKRNFYASKKFLTSKSFIYHPCIVSDLFWTCGKILVYTIVYILGRLNYSFAWIVPLFFTSIQDHMRNKRAVNKAATHAALKMDDKDAIYSRLDEIPAWVLFPDYERCEWINKIISQLWPRINNIVLKSLKDLEPVLQQNPILRNFTIKKVDFGKISPRITGIKVYNQNQLFVDEIIWDVNLCYFGDLEIIFSLNGIEGGIKDIELEGALRIVMKPVVSRTPIVSAVQIYFLKHPATNFELTMGLASLDMYATGELIRSILKDQISLYMVYPNKLHIKLDEKAPSTTFIMPEIEGIVRAHIYSVENAEGREIFLTVDLGQDYIKTPIISSLENGSNSFKFKFSRDLIAFRNGDEEVHMTLYKKDEESKSLKIGTISFNLQKIKEQKCITGDFNLPSLEVISSKICWLPITPENGDKCLLQVYVDSGRNIKSKISPFVELTVHDQTKKTPLSKIEDEIAIWEKHFNFFIENPEDEKLTIKLIDQNTSKNIGTYAYNIKDILQRKSKQHDLQTFPLNSSQNCEIVMALKLNFLKILQ